MRDGDAYVPHTVQVLTVTGPGISRNVVFQDRAVFAAFGLTPLPAATPVSGPAAPSAAALHRLLHQVVHRPDEAPRTCRSPRAHAACEGSPYMVLCGRRRSTGSFT